jgi:hypothetical protein
MSSGTSGYIQLRRGLFEHVRDGRLTFFEASLYVAILSDTNPSTGLCYGSAGLFAAVYGLTDRTCRDALEKLESKGYLRRFPTRGKHGSYPILVNKFRCSDGAMKGLYVNSGKSISWEKVFYESRDEGVDDDVNDSVNDSAASKRLETRNKKPEKEAELTLLSPPATPPVKPKIRLQDFPEAWNRLSGGLPKVQEFSDSRKKQVTARIRQGITVARFEEAVICCTEKPFLRGEGSRGWTADFDWLIKNDKNIEKAITQPYGGGFTGGKNHVNGNSKKPNIVETQDAELQRAIHGDRANSSANHESSVPAGDHDGQGTAGRNPRRLGPEPGDVLAFPATKSL